MAMDSWLLRIGTARAATYKGLLIRANPTLHEEAAMIIARRLARGARVVDVGAGQGAFALRLRDAGFDVLAADVNEQDFKAAGVNYRCVNFNDRAALEAFKAERSEFFDAAVGMEVIEHVENPWEYLRLLKSLVRPGGYVFLTTPNIESAYSKLSFLFTGAFAHFTRSDRETSGHINPLTELELRIIAEAQGLEVVSVDPLCRLPKLWITRNVPYLLYGVINLLLGWAFGRNANGDILCVVARKPMRSPERT